MGLVDFTDENKVTQITLFPKLKLEKGEKARIVLLAPKPYATYCHNLRRPKLSPDGTLIMEEKQTRKGEAYEQAEMEFVGRPVCRGDEGIVADKGYDEKGCPVCKAHREFPDQVDAPQRRFAMPIFLYKTKAGDSYELQKPFGGEVVAWAFTDQIFGKLVDFSNEFGSLQQRDLLLGPCTNPQYQQFDINIGNGAKYLDVVKDKKLAISIFKENQPTEEELRALCGRTAELRFLQDDVDKVLQRWVIVNGGGTPEQEVDAVTKVTEELADTLTDGVADEVAEELDGLLEPSEDEAVTGTKEAELEKKEPGESLDLDDMLAELDN